MSRTLVLHFLENVNVVLLWSNEILEAMDRIRLDFERQRQSGRRQNRCWFSIVSSLSVKDQARKRTFSEKRRWLQLLFFPPILRALFFDFVYCSTNSWERKSFDEIFVLLKMRVSFLPFVRFHFFTGSSLETSENDRTLQYFCLFFLLFHLWHWFPNRNT